MPFVANPLALSVPEPAFEAWLRDSGYLETLDTSSSSLPTSSASFPSSSSKPLPPKNPAAAVSGVISPVFFFLRTLASLFTINPFAKLTPEDFAGETPSWTLRFVGDAGSYSWPGGPSQARMRVQENVRRYARNYAFLCLVFFACSLYQMPILLLSLMESLGVWELLRFCSDKWELEEKHPAVRTILVCAAQFVMLAILYLSNLQVALFCTTVLSYTVMLLHASLRNLAPSKHSLGTDQHRRTYQKKINLPSK
ncbi:PRA1 family protein H [Dendrobium catenatum]|uniref:PRA1 family protein n=1 Tax=Dendrobium catenatum TaxID=906689 RepID=A0A2I0V9C2_9ASPA|nr:PRA1 family protein H [Dendrobium catenatum]PKU60015.1 PRA1 family protein H [Dendrobium catenatum]